MFIEKRYEWSFEVSGKNALYSRADCGSSIVSYPAPTRSAIMSMMNCLCFCDDAYFWPERVEICRPIVFCKYNQNYNGPLRKANGAFQIMMTVLENVDYKIYGVVKGYGPPTQNYNAMHQLRDMFERRLRKGLFYRMPSLGISEFTADYFGPLRDDTKVDESINITIPSMLDTMFDRPTKGRLSPKYVQNVQIQKGVLRYAQ